jgi:AcrR family transcriptional regulator
VPSSRSYNSPVRAQQVLDTREAILEALFRLLADAGSPDDIPMEAIARAAGVQRRTVFRHFAGKDDLLAAFWPWMNARMGAPTTPAAVEDVVDGPRRVFPLFEAHEAAMRAAIHSRTGRAMRRATVPERRAAFAAALAPALGQRPAAEARRIEALAHLLYSASAWEVLKDYGALTGEDAGEAASWALELILSAVGSGGDPADDPTRTQGDDR